MKRLIIPVVLCAACLTYCSACDKGEGDLTQSKEEQLLVDKKGEQPTNKKGWAELPVLKDSTSYQYVTHYANLNGKKVRNYTICYDPAQKGARWVAYPLHRVYTAKNVGRAEEWSFDPAIKVSLQSDCVTGSYKPYSLYDRGHQIPSADRLANRELNDQTFYMSNITPQKDRLNQDMWNKLEQLVRSNQCKDTLYVVTGAHYAPGNTQTAKDGTGSLVPVPTHYYKVLLRTKAGNTGKSIAEMGELGLQSIGFWVEHRSYGDIEPPRSIVTTVADIEAKTGFTFFPQVPAAVKKQKDPAKWGIR